jgi:radical SAM superfamily enzyme YgiQ (UPF0313 family)
MKDTKKIRKLLLIQPPVQDFYDTDIRLQPIGLCYLKAAVRQYHPDIEVKVLDFHQGWGRTTVPLPKELSYLKEYYFIPDMSPFRSFDQYFHFGASYEEIAGVVAKEQPDMVGISSNFSPYFREALHCARVIKEATGAIIVMGGSHVSCSPETVLRESFVDYVIKGEGERPLVELLSAINNDRQLRKVANLAYKKNGALFYNEPAENFPVDGLPRPDFSDITSTRYGYKKQPICMVMTSRGCPHQCTFCSVRKTFGPKYRIRKPAAVVQEMEKRYQEGYRIFDFEDDNLTFNMEQFKELCALIEEKFQGKDIQLLAMNGISYKSLDAEVLAAMRKAGFTHLNLALVSANVETLRNVKRPHSIDNFTHVVASAFEYGFEIVAYQILGLPHESLDAMIDTLIFLAHHPLLIGVSVFYLTPGSPIANEFPDIREPDIFRSRSTAMAIETEHCCREDLYTLFIMARVLNFLKGISVAAEETHINDLIQQQNSFEQRTQSGLMILGRLFSEHKLYASTKKGPQLVRKFDYALFLRLWSKLDHVKTQQGKRILINQEFDPL